MIEQEEETYRWYNLMVINSQQNSVFTYCITSKHDLVQVFKTARMEENRWLVWEKGCIRMDAILGVMEQ